MRKKIESLESDMDLLRENLEEKGIELENMTKQVAPKI